MRLCYLQVIQLENDLKTAEQKYSISSEHKVALEEQLDAMRVQKSTLENMLEKEKNSRRAVQQGLTTMCFAYLTVICFAQNLTNCHLNISGRSKY